MNLPSHQLTDKFATILARGFAEYVPWDRLTSRGQELLEEPEVKGLRITADGTLQQDIEVDMKADISGDFLWDFAMCRRSAAMDIAGLMDFESADLWHQTLKSLLMKEPPAGYRHISWGQLVAADRTLFQFVTTLCECDTKAPPDKTETAFQTAWKEGTFDLEARTYLCTPYCICRRHR